MTDRRLQPPCGSCGSEIPERPAGPRTGRHRKYCDSCHPKAARPRSCIACGCAMPTPKGGRLGGACDDCKGPNGRIYRNECQYCGKRSADKAKRKYCGDECRSMRPKLRDRQQCKGCERTFSASGVRAYCSDSCRSAAAAIKVVRTCADCDASFEALPRNVDQQLWCAPCKRTRKRKHSSTRRARKMTTQVEPIDPREIFDRDGWRCGICERRVDRRLRYPHPLSASLDHIEALSLGGTHTRENVQLAHLTCNIRKGSNRAPAQLRLIG